MTQGDAPRAEPPLGLVQILTPADGAARLRVRDLVRASADRGFGLALVFVAFPALIPFFPPGASMVVGLLVIVVAIQMLLGRRQLWLPSRALDYVFSERATRALVAQGEKWEQRFRRVTKPRLGFMTGRLASAFVAVPTIGIGVALFLPLPFLNSLPAIAVITIGIGLAKRDGLLVLLGTAVCLGILVALAAMPGLLMQGLRWFR